MLYSVCVIQFKVWKMRVVTVYGDEREMVVS